MAGAKSLLVWDREGPGMDDVVTNTLHWSTPGSGLENYQALADDIVAWWEAQGAGSMRARYCVSVSLREVRVYELPQVDPDAEAIATSGAGGLAPDADAMPPQIASTCTLETANRRHWGRNYWGPLSRVAVGAGGRFTTAFCTDVVNGVAALRNGVLASSGYTLGVFERGTLDVIRPAVGLRVDDIPDVIRSRRFRAVINRSEVDF